MCIPVEKLICVGVAANWLDNCARAKMDDADPVHVPCFEVLTRWLTPVRAYLDRYDRDQALDWFPIDEIAESARRRWTVQPGRLRCGGAAAQSRGPAGTGGG
jgi:hypothetical protein